MRSSLEYSKSLRRDVSDDGFSLPWSYKFAKLTAPLARYFRFRMRGFENVPKEPCILVSNHTVGGPFEIVLFHKAWRDYFGDRSARGLTHRGAWRWPIRSLGILQRMGAIMGNPDVAAQAFRDGHSLLVYPGGDVDCFKPFGRRDDIDFGGRYGFIRLARRTGAAIAPVVVCGAHATYVVVPGAARLTRLLGLKRLMGMQTFPLTAGMLLMLAGLVATLLDSSAWPALPITALLALIPMPARIDMSTLPPFYVRATESDAAAAARLRATMLVEMQRLVSERRTPWG